MATSILKNPYPQRMSGVAIPAGADLDDYTMPGVYYIGSSSIAGQISNIPYTSSGGRLEVIGMHSDTDFIRQFYYPSATDFFTRYYYASGGWTNWFRVLRQVKYYNRASSLNASPQPAFGVVGSNSKTLSLFIPMNVDYDMATGTDVVITSCLSRLYVPTGGYLLSRDFNLTNYITSISMTGNSCLFIGFQYNTGFGVTSNLPVLGTVVLTATFNGSTT